MTVAELLKINLTLVATWESICPTLMFLSNRHSFWSVAWFCFVHVYAAKHLADRKVGKHTSAQLNNASTAGIVCPQDRHAQPYGLVRPITLIIVHPNTSVALKDIETYPCNNPSMCVFHSALCNITIRLMASFPNKF